MPTEAGGAEASPASIIEDAIADRSLMEQVAAVGTMLRRRGICICISGIDGAGKTLLAKQLRRVLGSVAIEARYLHRYRWYDNVFVVPWILLVNRLWRKRVLIFDRAIYDNLVYTLARVAELQKRERWLGLGLRWVALFYPRFDHRFYLVVPFELARRRRPDIVAEDFRCKSQLYHHIARSAGFSVYRSDGRTLRKVLSKLTPDAAALGSQGAGALTNTAIK